MKKCTDCIHDEVCDMWAVESGLPFVNAETCDHFKNKADFVETETIKAWLYEIKINNMGFVIHGNFSEACEEIISRLDGLRNLQEKGEMHNG